jgi:hypothetical protein
MFIAILGATVLMAAADTQTAQAGCDPHYTSETCLPIATDVDCAGGKGNGPAYVRGPFEYRGDDIYDLDVDGDGVACEPPPKR